MDFQKSKTVIDGVELNGVPRFQFYINKNNQNSQQKTSECYKDFLKFLTIGGK